MNKLLKQFIINILLIGLLCILWMYNFKYTIISDYFLSILLSITNNKNISAHIAIVLCVIIPLIVWVAIINISKKYFVINKNKK